MGHRAAKLNSLKADWGNTKTRPGREWRHALPLSRQEDPSRRACNVHIDSHHSLTDSDYHPLLHEKQRFSILNRHYRLHRSFFRHWGHCDKV